MNQLKQQILNLQSQSQPLEPNEAQRTAYLNKLFFELHLVQEAETETVNLKFVV